jgi:hypothetical protein
MLPRSVMEAGVNPSYRIPGSFCTIQFIPCHAPDHTDAMQRLLDHKAFNTVLKLANLGHEVAGLVRGDGSSDDGAGDTASATKGSLAGNIDVGNILVLGEQRQVQQDCQRGSIGGQDDDFRSTTVESLGRCL